MDSYVANLSKDFKLKLTDSIWLLVLPLQGDLLIKTQEFISEKFRSGILAPIKQKLKVEVKKEGGEEDEVEVEYHGRK